MNSEISQRIISSVILIPVALFFIIKGSFFFNLFVAIFFIVSSYEWNRMSKKKNTKFLVLFSY